MRQGPRLPLIIAALLLFGWFTAALAQAGEISATSPQYTNGRCQSYAFDADCFHSAGIYTTHQGCVNKMGSILGVNPNTDKGRFWINQATWMCRATPPTGRYSLFVYQSSPPCKVGLPFSQCPR